MTARDLNVLHLMVVVCCAAAAAAVETSSTAVAAQVVDCAIPSQNPVTLMGCLETSKGLRGADRSLMQNRKANPAKFPSPPPPTPPPPSGRGTVYTQLGSGFFTNVTPPRAACYQNCVLNAPSCIRIFGVSCLTGCANICGLVSIPITGTGK